MKVLVVDDEINIANGIAEMIKSCPDFSAKIEVTDSAEKALAISRKFHPDLLVSDIQMPGMNGLELIRKMETENLCRYYLILSGYDKFEYAQKALRYNVMDYLLKPINRKDLLEQCKRVYRQLPLGYSSEEHRELPAIDYFQWKPEIEKYPKSLQKILQYMEGNYMQSITLTSISEEFFLHSSYISTLINKHTGKSFLGILDYYRLCKAADILMNEPEISVQDTSYLVGYNSVRQFYKVFQKNLNCTPAKFREENKRE